MKEIQSPRELRGIPLVGGRRSSAIAGTDPLSTLLRKEARGRMRPPQSLEPIPRSTLSISYERKGAPQVTRATREAGRFFVGR